MITAVQKAKNGDEQRLATALPLLYKTVLELIGTQALLTEILVCLCDFMERQFDGLVCSLLLVDSDGVTLRHGAAPGLSAEYIKAIDGAKIGPSTGSCGTAAYRGKPVVVTDIATDPLWKDYRQFALPVGLRACWSTPILSRAGKVLGTFAVYYREPRAPDPVHMQFVDCATHLAGIALERERADVELHSAETRYRALVEHLPAITYLAEVGVLGIWHFVSPQIQSFLGFSPEEWLADSSNWVNHIHPDDRDLVFAEETRFSESGGTFHSEYRMLARDGRVRWFLDEATYLRTGDRHKPLMQGVLYDISERKQLEEQVRHAQKMEAVGKLAGGVAHDFNNLLMIIQGHNEQLLGRLPQTDPGHEHASEIKNATTRAASLTSQLLAFSRKQVLQPSVLDLNEVITEVGKMLQRLIGEDIAVHVDTAASLWPVKVDQSQIEQVLLNLALNARDAMPNGGKLTFSTKNAEVDATRAGKHGSKPGRYVVIEVSDTGVGMDAETQNHVFEPFFSTKELGKGTGLGLASVYGIVQQSGGWISFRSRVGHGTTFSIHLPQAGEPPSAVKKETPVVVACSKGTETILVVEDEEEIRDLVTQYLERGGYTVLQATNGREAQNVARGYKGPIHLLVTDVVMPHVSGYELAEHLRKLRPGTKVLFTSGYPEHSGVDDKLTDPHASILQKPFSLSGLAEKIREILDPLASTSLAASSDVSSNSNIVQS
ncbi:MAG: ATP-binding protein [Terriglobales bacterium]